MDEFANAAVGCKVAVNVELLYVTEALTTVLDASSNWNVLLLTLVGSSALLKVAVTAAVVLTPADPFVGENEVTTGGWVGRVVLKTTSTQ